MKVSRRAEAMAPFFAMEFGKRAAALQSAGHDVIKLNVGEPDFGALPAVLDAAHAAIDKNDFGYTAALGTPALREAIADFYRRVHNVDVPAERVVVTSGASAALLMTTAALVDPGDEVMIGDPSYPCNRQFLSSCGANVQMIATTPASRFQLDLATVEKHWTTQTRGLLIATPSNPTGTSVLPHELRQLCEFARARNAWRVVDEIYLNLADHDSDGRSPQTALAFDPEAIIINSFSKYFGMTGWRLGWCVVPEALVPTIERLAQNFYICPSTVSQQAALACFTKESLSICEERRAEFARRRALTLEGLQSIGLPVPVPPDGAFYVYFDVSQTGMSSWEFCEAALNEAHVALTPGKDFGNCGADTYVRLSYAASMTHLREAIERLGRLTRRMGIG